MKQQNTKIPEKFIPFTIGLPPMFLKMADYNGNARFVGINYFGSKATWHDGRGSATFSYFAVYSPFIHHPAIVFTLRGGDLGSDDTEPNCTIILDRDEMKLYLAEYKEAVNFLNEQHPPVEPVKMTMKEFEAIKQKYESLPNDLESMQRLGMFELFGGFDNRKRETEDLIDWMDQRTTDEVKEFFSRIGFIMG